MHQHPFLPGSPELSCLVSIRCYIALLLHNHELLRASNVEWRAAYLLFCFGFLLLQTKEAVPSQPYKEFATNGFESCLVARLLLHNILHDLQHPLAPLRLFVLNQYNYDSIAAQKGHWQTGKPKCFGLFLCPNNDRCDRSVFRERSLLITDSIQWLTPYYI